jgi:hypothetical protein
VNFNRIYTSLGLVFTLATVACGSADDENSIGNPAPTPGAAGVVEGAPMIPATPAATGGAPATTPAAEETAEDGEERAPTAEPEPSKTPMPQFDHLPRGMMPLFMVGDLNQDRRVDDTDLELFADHLEADAPVACQAAADVDGNSVVDLRDYEILVDAFATEGEIVAAPLGAHPRLPCEYSNPIAAAKFGVYDDVYSVLFLDPTVAEGPVTIQVDSPQVSFTQLDGAQQVDFHVGEMNVGATATATFDLGENGAFTFSMVRQETPASAPPEETDPRDEPTPVPYGEEIDDGVCPQRGLGCEALVVDFSYHVEAENDLRKTRDALVAAGCNVEYVTPILFPIPGARQIKKSTGTVTIQPDDHDVTHLSAHNQRELQAANEAIAGHRARVREGRDLALQIVNAHGSDNSFGGCGVWGVGFPSGFYLDRTEFHQGNLDAARRNVCASTVEDLSCYAGLSTLAVDAYHNLGVAGCGLPRLNTQPLHAGYEHDVVLASSAANEFTTDLKVGLRNEYLTQLITDHTLPGNEFRLLIAAYMQEALNSVPEANNGEMKLRYADRGYASRFASEYRNY